LGPGWFYPTPVTPAGRRQSGNAHLISWPSAEYEFRFLAETFTEIVSK